METALIQALQNPNIFPHAVQKIELMQTHLSWVILTGDIAYKIKKPLNLGFQDFTTLEKRKYYCGLELELNKRLAPQLYLDVISITGSAEHPILGGNGTAIEYAIKMRQFNQQEMLSQLAVEQKLTPRIMKNIAKQLAEFHQQAEKAPSTSDFGTYTAVTGPMTDNFTALFNMPAAQPWHAALQMIQNWTAQQSQTLKPVVAERKARGWIRAAHGDVHLGNMVLMQDRPVIFDCIEFNESFRWTDTMSDVSFLFMDLLHKKQKELAYIFLNHYLEASGDYQGLILLHYYACYRAMVRAKVSGFQMAQLDPESSAYRQLNLDLGDYIQLAKELATGRQPSLTVTVGISGTGKSSYSEKWMARNQAIRLRSDVIRKQLFNLPLYEPTPNKLKTQVYSDSASERVFQKLREYAKMFLSHNLSVIIDATCIKTWQRDLFSSLADEMHLPFQIILFEASLEDVAEHIKKRSKYKQVSDADLSIAKSQLLQFEGLTEKEQAVAQIVTKQDMIEWLVC